MVNKVNSRRQEKSGVAVAEPMSIYTVEFDY